ncbi:MAG TPA: glycosyltransferase family 9 protein [bacterium]|nr:glycosyltransferase family 9 protein [bacterium]
MSPPSPDKILFIRLKAIGDVVLCTPLIRALRRAYPKAQIDFLADAFPARLLGHNPYLNRVLTAPPKGSSWKTQWDFFKALRRNRYDLVFDLFGNPRSAWMALLSGAPARVGYAYRGRRWAYSHPVPMNRVRKYQVEVNLDVLRHWGIEADGARTEIFLTEDERREGESTLGLLGLPKNGAPRVGLNPTGTWSAKRWPRAYWRDLISLLNGKGIRPILLTGPSDGEELAAIRRGLEEQSLAAPETDLRQLAGIIQGLDLLIGNDGAPQHIAQALDVRSLTLFGPTWGISWNKPEDPRHLFLQDAPPCGPCDKTLCPNPREPLAGHPAYQECLTRLTPEKVARSAAALLRTS